MNSKKGNNIITIGREFGSGGRELGRSLAEELGYEYYDNEIIMETPNILLYQKNMLNKL